MRKALQIVEELVSEKTDEHERRNKIVVVSQFVQYLRLFKRFLENIPSVTTVLMWGKTNMNQRDVSMMCVFIILLQREQF